MIITLLNGIQIDTGDVLFNSANLDTATEPVFTYSPLDPTTAPSGLTAGQSLDNLIKFADMPDFDGWDNTKWLTYRAAHPIYGTPVSPTLGGSTSVAANFFTQIFTNPLAAPEESLSNWWKNTATAAEKGVAVVIVAGFLFLGATLLLKSE